LFFKLEQGIFGSNFSRVFYKLIFFFFYLIQATKHAFAQDHCNPSLPTGTPKCTSFYFKKKEEEEEEERCRDYLIINPTSKLYYQAC